MTPDRKRTFLIAVVFTIPVVITLLFGQMGRKAALLPSIYYVSQNGSGTACSILIPCSLSTGMSKMVPGDTLHLEGTIKAGVIFAKSGTANAHMSLTGGKIDAPHSVQNALLVSGSHVDVYNIEVTGGSSFGIRTKGSYLRFWDFSVHDAVWENRSGEKCIGGSGGWGRGMTTGPTSFSVEVYDGKIYRNCGEGFSTTQSNNVYIHDMEIYDNFSRNVYVGNSPYITISNVYTYCKDPNFYRNGRPARGIGLAIETTNYGIYHNQLHDIVIRGNTIENCLGTNFYSEVSGQYPSDVLVEGNRYINVPTPAISIPGNNIIIRDNVIGTATPLSTPHTPTPTFTPRPTGTQTLIPCPSGWQFDHVDALYIYCRKAR